MSDPTIDTNQWYHLYVNEDDRQSLLGTSLYTGQGTKGAVFINFTDTSINTQRWQIFPVTVNATRYYTLRCKESGPNAFMGVGYVSTEVTPGKTRAQLFRGDVIQDNGVFWSFGSWNDGTWSLSNAENTTKYNLNKKTDGLIAMDSDTKAPQNGQRWQLGAIAKIDDPRYSSVNLQNVVAASTSSTSSPGPTSANPSPSSRPSDSTSTNAPSDNSSSGLSTAAKAGIGAGVGGGMLILLIVLGLFFLKKRKQRAAYAPTYELPPDAPSHDYHHAGSAVKYEMSSADASEVPNTERPAELPGSSSQR